MKWIKKTEMVIFKSKQKKFEGDLKIRLYPTESIEYLERKIDTNFSWQYHITKWSFHELIRANALN